MDDSAIGLSVELATLARTAPPGTRLPSTRELQRRHHVGPATVQRAVADLARRGLVRTQPGEGTFTMPPRPEGDDRVDSTAARGPANHEWQTWALGPAIPGAETMLANLELPTAGMVSLGTGYLDESLQPLGLLAQAATRAARRPAAWSRPPTEGVDELRLLFAGELGAGIDPRHVLIAPGGQSALSTCFRSLAAPGDRLIVESPTYQGALGAARTAGLVPLGVPIDADGLRADLLAEALDASGAKLIYAQPRWVNPTGVRMSAQRRQEILDVLHHYGAFLIEDDAARDLDLAEPAFTPLVVDDPDGHVVYLRSLTKSVAPALRIAAVVARGPAFTRLRGAQSVQTAFVSTPLQHIAADLLTAPGWPRHLRHVRRQLALRRDALITAIEGHLPTWSVPHRPTCGLHLWVRLPDDTDEAAVVRAGETAGVRLAAGGAYYPAESVGSHLRISYAAHPPAAIAAAIEAVAAVL
jgi:DNA-binding transcriptional MocR family regulator